MKIIYLISAALVLTGCKLGMISENISKMETVNSPGTQDTLESKQFVYAVVNGKKLRFLFDTGATISFINNIDLLGGESILTDRNHIKKSTQSAKGEFESIVYFSETFILNTSRSKFLPVGTVNVDLGGFKCSTTEKYDGVLGLNVYGRSIYPIVLDYEDNFIKVSESADIPKEYSIVKAEFETNSIKLSAIVNEKEIELLFDTGADAAVILNKAALIEQVPDAEYKSLVTTGSGLSIFNEKVYKTSDVQVHGLNLPRQWVHISEEYEQCIAGFRLISQYNWIIDFHNKKLYAKRNTNQNEDAAFEKILMKQQLVTVLDGKLLVAYTSSTSEHNVMDEIKSVNSVMVTSDNICELQDILNQSSNWNGLNVEIVRAKP